MDPRKPFNPYVRSKHTGLSPFRSSFNMGPQFLYASSRQLGGTQQGTSVRSLDLRDGSSVLQSIHNRPTGAIPKKIINRNNQARAHNDQKENRRGRANRPRKREEPANPNIVPEPVPRYRTPSPHIIYLPEPENGPSSHRDRLKAETSWLVERADSWEKVKDDVPDLPDWVVGTIESTVGGIRLLVSSKFKQFRNLIELCASRFKIVSRIPVPVQSSDPPQQSSSQQSEPALAAGGSGSSEQSPRATNPAVLPEDLDGFWDTMYLQVQSLRKKLETLDQAKENNWQEPQQVVPLKKKAPPNLTKPRSFQSSGRSKFREFLQTQMLGKDQDPGAAEPVKEAPAVGTYPPTSNGPHQAMNVTPKPLGALARCSLDSGIDTPRNCAETPMPSTPWRSLLADEDDDPDTDMPCEVFVDINFSPLFWASNDRTARDSLAGASRCRRSRRVQMTPVAITNLRRAETSRRSSSFGARIRVSLLGRLPPEDSEEYFTSDETNAE